MILISDTDKEVVNGLVQVAKWIGAVIISGSALSLAVCILRITNQFEFTILGVKLKLALFPYVVVGLTVAHAFLTWGFNQEVNNVRVLGNDATVFAWERLRGSEAVIFNGMQPRIWHESSNKKVRGWYAANSDDRAYWASALFAVGLEIATYFSLAGSDEKLFALDRRSFNNLGLGGIFALVNWIIGTRWAVAASLLVK